MSGRPVVHILGCGRAARAVARRLHDSGRIRIGLVVNRSRASAEKAVEFIGAGEAADALDERIAGDWLLLGLPDGVLAAFDERLPARPALAFQLSGSVPALALSPLAEKTASVHPVRAFADPDLARRRFAGTWCVAEGDALALASLQPIFEAAGGRWLAFEASDKPAWHAATVAASNYLVTVQQLARELAAAAGLPDEQVAQILCDLQQGTLEGLRERAPRQALTGPIERGDLAACRRLTDAAAQLPEEQAMLFAALGRATLDLAQAGRGARDADRALRALFSPTSD